MARAVLTVGAEAPPMIAPPPTALRALAVIAVSLVACDGVEAVRCEGLCVADAATDAMGDVSTSDAPRAAQDATATDAPTADVTATDVDLDGRGRF